MLRLHLHPPCVAFAVILAGLIGCGDDTASTGSASAGETGGATTLTSAGATNADAGSADVTGFEPDPDACLPDPTPTPCPLGTVAPCCADSPPGVACPGIYPHNWTCNPSTLECELGNCTLNGTECADLFTGFSCMTIGQKNLCVFACTDNEDCEDSMPMTECIASDVPAKKYCRQAL